MRSVHRCPASTSAYELQNKRTQVDSDFSSTVLKVFLFEVRFSQLTAGNLQKDESVESEQ